METMQVLLVCLVSFLTVVDDPSPPVYATTNATAPITGEPAWIRLKHYTCTRFNSCWKAIDHE